MSSIRSQAPWLTVIMPAYCGERWIDDALGSIAAEGADGIEVMLIDGSPTSATRDVAGRYEDRLRIRTFQRPDLGSWHEKTNFGVQIAQTAHICWLHVDDVWLPGRVAAVRRWIERAPQASLHLAPSTIIDRSGRRLGVWRCPFPTDGEISPTMISERLLVQNSIAAPAPVFRKDAWAKAGGLDESLWYTADWDIWLKLAGTGPVYYHSDITCGFRIHGSSLTVTGSREITDFGHQMCSVLERHLPQLGRNSPGVERAARASIAVNTALASAAAGHPRDLLNAARTVLRLGPSGIHRFLRDSRLLERVLPRLRARLRGAF